MKNIYDIIIIIVSIIALLLSILSLTKSEKFGISFSNNAVCDDKDWQKSRWPQAKEDIWGDYCHKWLSWYGCDDNTDPNHISDIRKDHRNSRVDISCQIMREHYPHFTWNYNAPPGLSLEPKLFGIF